MRFDQWSAFRTVRWTRRADAVGTVIQTSRVESHNSIGSNERYNTPLRRIFNKIEHESHKMDRKIVSRIAVKATNDTMGPNGLVPSYLVLGVPRFTPVDSTLPDQQSCMNAFSHTRQEMATNFSELRVQKALTSRVPHNAELKIEPGDKVRIYRKTDKMYVGPQPVIRVEGMQFFVVINDHKIYGTFGKIA